MKKSYFLFIFVFAIAGVPDFIGNTVLCQDTRYVRKQLLTLCSPEMHGRGYYNRGDSIAAFYIADQFRKLGVKSFTGDFIQRYNFNVNRINRTIVKFNGQELKFNSDYIVTGYSGSVKGTFNPVVINASLMQNPDKFIQKLNESLAPRLIVLDSSGLKNPALYKFIRTLASGKEMGIAALIEISPATPGTFPGRWQNKAAEIKVTKSVLPEDLTKVDLDIESEYFEHYPTQNVIGYLPGETDQYIVFTAHYDGYGSYGESNYNSAAQDNGSGTAMVMDLARHYRQGKKPYYSVAFMLFSGEEVGLMGSKYYVAHPEFPLDKIKLVINLDMVMTGQDGVILFNGNGRPNEAAIVQKINEEHQYMKNIENRDGTANSDHYPFQEKGIPAIFFLTKGASGRGHGPDDTYDKLPLYAYENLFKLVIAIPEELKKQEIHWLWSMASGLSSSSPKNIFGNFDILWRDEEKSNKLELLDKIKTLDGVTVTEIAPKNGYSREFQLDIIQPVDHNNPDGPKFTQRAYLSHVDEATPMVFAPNGYRSTPSSSQELALLCDMNCLLVTQRYFYDSRPDPLDWKYLTIRQAADDTSFRL